MSNTNTTNDVNINNFPINDLQTVLDYLYHDELKDFMCSDKSDEIEELDGDFEENLAIYARNIYEGEGYHIFCPIARLQYWLDNQTSDSDEQKLDDTKE